MIIILTNGTTREVIAIKDANEFMTIFIIRGKETLKLLNKDIKKITY